MPVPVYILPGNHDPLNAGSVYRSSVFIERRPAHVHVIESATPVKVGDCVEIVGAPWMSKRPVTNPIEEALTTLPPASGITRICMGHGAVDLLTPDRESARIIEVSALERAIDEGKFHFVALGDRHSITKLGSGERVWYSGTPEPTRFSETRPGRALVVEVGDDRVATKEVQVGQWRFIELERVELNSADDVKTHKELMEEMENKERTILRLNLVGTLSLSSHCLLHDCLDDAEDVFGALEVREDDLLVLPDDADFDDLGFSGSVDAAVQRLRSCSIEGGDESATARDALMLLLRLAGKEV